MPQGKHSLLRGDLITTINVIAEKQKIALAFPELRCTFGGRSIVPDVAVFAWDRIPVDANGDIENVFRIQPDWTIEILSPEQRPTKVTANILHCLDHGCQMGWLIDPDDRSLLAYPHGQQPKYFQTGSEALPMPSFISELQLTIDEIFDWLKL